MGMMPHHTPYLASLLMRTLRDSSRRLLYPLARIHGRSGHWGL